MSDQDLKKLSDLAKEKLKAGRTREQALQSFIDAGLWDEARIFTGNTMLGAGIAAPLLSGSTLSLDTPIEDDRLKVFVNKNSAYPYVEDMEL